MKKNWFMRIAGVMLALAMITSCFVGSTFAKYVTKAEGADNARVAKFGILLGMSSDGIFKTEYATDETGDNAYQGDVSVQSSGAYTVADVDYDKVVAPGTTNNFVATVYGTPEVAVRYQLVINDLTDIVLPAGEYTDYTHLVTNDQGEIGYFDTFTLEHDYAPIMWDIIVENSIGTKIGLLEYALDFLGYTVNPDDGTITVGTGDEAVTFNFKGFSATGAKEIVTRFKAALEALLPTVVHGASNAHIDVDSDGIITISMDFDPNIEMDYTFTLAWAWNFEGNLLVIEGGHSTAPVYFLADDVDKADTFLGNYMAYLMGDNADLWTQDQKDEFDALDPEMLLIKANFVATATQID